MGGQRVPAVAERGHRAVALRGGVERIDELAREWDLLCDEGPCDAPFYRPWWIAAYLRSFAPGARVVAVAVRRGGRLRAVLPLVEDRMSPIPGGPVFRRLRGAAGVHSCRFDLVHGRGDGAEAATAAWEAIRRMGGWDVLELRDVPQDGAARGILEAARRDGHPVGRREAMRAPYVPLRIGGMAAPGAGDRRPGPGAMGSPGLGLGLGAKFRSNLRRRRRRLETRGRVSWRRCGAADAELLEAFFALERRGWKGRRGTAVDQDPGTRAFYRRIAREAATRGVLALHALELDGRPVAVHFGLEAAGRYYLPKPAYDEAHRDCSPGHLLVEEVLRDAAGRQLEEFDFLGPWMEWKGEWTRHVRPHEFLFVYGRGPAGRLLHGAKFGVAPALRRLGVVPLEERDRMEALARRFGDGDPGGEARSGLLASALPALRPGMLLPRRRRGALPFPFDDPGVRYFYYARNGIYALARLWNLAGKEVLFPAYFHGVELEALLEAGVRPRFYPVDERMRVDPAEVERRIGPDTRAIYLIHYVGFPGPVEELREVCDRRGLLLVEDCALALLSCLGDRPLGTFGDAAVFCLYKTLPTPNGGALVIRGGGPIGLPEGDPPPLAATFAHAASSLLVGFEVSGGATGRAVRRVGRGLGHAAVRFAGLPRVPTGTPHFDRSRVGLAMSRLSRRVIEAQDFPAIVERRRRNYFHFLGRLRDLATPVFGELPVGVCPLFFPFPVRDKQTVLARLRARGVEAVDFWRVGHPAVPPGSFPGVDELRQTVIELPCHQDLEPSAVDRMAAIVREAVRGRG